MIDQRVRAVLDRLEARDSQERESGAPREVRLRQVTPDVGRFLHNLVLTARPRSLIEIGTSGGYSTAWIASAASAAGGSLTTLENDPVKVALARETLRDAGLDRAATIVE